VLIGYARLEAMRQTTEHHASHWQGIELTGLALHSGRLTLRPWQASDAEVVARIMADERMHTYLKLPQPYTLDAARSFVTDLGPSTATAGTGLNLAVAENSTGRVVAAIGLHGLANDSVLTEIGYWVGTSDWGQGFAVEATRTMARFAFANGARRIEIRADVANVGSSAVALRAGFHFEGVLRSQLESSSGPADCALFARLATDPDDSTEPSWPRLTELTDGVVSLRPMRPGDGPVVFAEENNLEARRWSLSDQVPTLAESAALAEQAGLNWLVGTHARILIRDAASDAPAGTMVLRRSGPPNVVGIGYGVLEEFRGRGFTARALELLAQWAFANTDIYRLELGCKPDNIASARAAERAGFVREGVLAGRLRKSDGGYDDEIKFRRLRPR
jgi:RimJ/RimL family protein N-acetyltransferase